MHRLDQLRTKFKSALAVKNSVLANSAAWFLIAVFFVIFNLVALHRFWQYASWYYDFGIFYQAIHSVSQGRAPIIDHFIFQGKNILGDHFHPLIFIISPIVALIPEPEVLLIVQTLFVALSGYFIYLTAKQLTNHSWESVALLLIYLSFVGLHNALITEFHAITLLPLPLSIMLYALVSRKLRLYLFSWAAVLLTKETTFVITFFFGLYLVVTRLLAAVKPSSNQQAGISLSKLIELLLLDRFNESAARRKKWLWTGLITAVFSLGYGYAIINWVIPAIGGRPYLYLDQARSHFSWEEIFVPHKLKTVVQTFISFGLLPLAGPEFLPPVIFNWWSRFVSEGTRYDLGMHYNAEIAPTLMLAAITGYRRIKRWLVNFLPAAVVSVGLGLLAVFSLGLSVYVFKSPARLAFNRAFYQHTQNFEFLDQLLEHIPDEGTVMAQHNLAGKLADRKVYILRNKYQQFQPDYIVIDTRDGQEPNNFLGIKDFEQLVEDLEQDPSYQIYYDQGEQKIYQRIDSAVSPAPSLKPAR